MRNVSLLFYVLLIGTVPFHTSDARAWNDATHMAVAKAAGLDDYAHLAVGADMAKEKAGDVESGNHFNNTPKGVQITPAMILSQMADYNRPGDADGHLYGAILAAINDYVSRNEDNKYAMYPFFYAAHYLADLSMPLHNILFTSFNRSNHAANDGIVETGGPENESMRGKVDRIAGEIQKRMATLPPIGLAADDRNFYQNLASHVATIANKSAALGYAMADSTPQRKLMTQEEAYGQLALSARLLKAVSAAVFNRPHQ